MRLEFKNRVAGENNEFRDNVIELITKEGYIITISQDVEDDVTIHIQDNSAGIESEVFLGDEEVIFSHRKVGDIWRGEYPKVRAEEEEE
jgi:hypothetical protein